MIEIFRRNKTQSDAFGRPMDGFRVAAADPPAAVELAVTTADHESADVVAVDNLIRLDELVPGRRLEDEVGRRWQLAAVLAREPRSSDVGEAVTDHSALLLARDDHRTAILTLHLLDYGLEEPAVETFAVTSPYDAHVALREPAAVHAFLRQAVAALPADDQRDIEDHVWGGGVHLTRTPFGRGYFSMFESRTVRTTGSGFSFDPRSLVYEATFQRTWWQRWKPNLLLLLLDEDGAVLFCGRQLS